MRDEEPKRATCFIKYFDRGDEVELLRRAADYLEMTGEWLQAINVYVEDGDLGIALFLTQPDEER